VDPLTLPPDELRRLGHHVWDRLVDRWEQLDSQPPIAPIDPDFDQHSIAPCNDLPGDPQRAIDELFDELLPRGMRADHPRFFARVGSPSNPVSVLADLIGTGHNTFVGSWTGSAGASAVELATLDWLRSWMGMPESTEGILVSGGSVGTLTALAAAAHARVDDRDQATAYVQEHTHAAITKAWSILGFNAANLRVLRADPDHRLQPAAIDAAIHIDREAGLEPFAVIGTAGCTSTGSVDPLNDLADLAQREGLWLHVDGAYGAPARLTPRGADLLAGIERADSLVLDPHKWLFQPYEIGAVLVRHAGALQHAFTLDGAYLRDSKTDFVELREYGPQLTRGARALKLYLSLRTFGLDAFRAAIAHCIALAEHAEALLEADPEWEVSAPASLAVICFRRAGHSDEQTDEMVRRAVADGFTAPSTTVLDGRTAARLCTINPRTTYEDIERTIERLRVLSDA
jgi:glutamate/tyrosine decarboxylase-like PLP-dependent enzyme